jgi:hypothetical protein
MKPTRKIIPCIMFYIFVSWLVVLFAARTHAEIVEFELDEVINAIKQEIEAARALETGPPRLIIEQVDIYLSVHTKEEFNRSTSVKVNGFAGSADRGSVSGTKQSLSFVLMPSGEPEVSKNPRRGLVQAIQRVVSKLKNATDEPPVFDLGSFTFTLQFAVEKRSDGGIYFNLFNLKTPRAKGLTHTIVIKMALAE